MLELPILQYVIPYHYIPGNNANMLHYAHSIWPLVTITGPYQWFCMFQPFNCKFHLPLVAFVSLTLSYGALWSVWPLVALQSNIFLISQQLVAVVHREARQWRQEDSKYGCLQFKIFTENLLFKHFIRKDIQWLKRVFRSLLAHSVVLKYYIQIDKIVIFAPQSILNNQVRSFHV